MKTSKAQKTTTVSVGDGPPRVVPLDKEDEYASGKTSALCLFRYVLPFFCLFYPAWLARTTSILVPHA
jgi:hypothetical protein